ncbi:Arylamine N-acetyltransferase 1 [Manis javanica]|nr:Arylamine N-acetyltransferase 1 [Manis javanica]
MDIEAYFERIGYKSPGNKVDLGTLTDILQHHIRAIPFENLNIHCGQYMDLGLEAIFYQIVRRNRGGWCLQVNQLLYWALTTVGFDTKMLGGNVYSIHTSKYSHAMIHLLVKVTVNGRDYIVDAGFGGSYQMWQPLELISGKDQPQGSPVILDSGRSSDSREGASCASPVGAGAAGSLVPGPSPGGARLLLTTAFRERQRVALAN